jgi:hypothetical protein
MTEALATTRRRYEATPRALDDDLQRMARGDRGCLGDVIAGLGALAIVVFGVLASFSYVGWGFMMIGTVMLLAGFVLSAAAQVRSAPLRRRALTEGPLVLARVVAADPALYEPGDAVLPARVVFAPDPARRFDGAFLRELGQRLQALQRADTTPPEQTAVAAVLREPNRVDTVRLPATLAGADEAYLAVVAVDQRRLPGRRIEDGELTLIVDPRSGFAEHV